jgi:hypothetical protein
LMFAILESFDILLKVVFVYFDLKPQFKEYL